MNWFRFYTSVLDDPKVQRLPGDVFKVWANLLCLASKVNHATGELPPVPDIAFALRLSVPETTNYLEGLAGEELLDRTRGGGYAIHNWANRQKPSDSSTVRVQKHRRKRPPVTGNSTETVARTNGNGAGTADVTLHETPVERPGNALDQIRSDQIREEKIINAGARDDGDDDDAGSIFGLFKKLTGRNTTPRDLQAAMYLDGKGVSRELCEAGIRLAVERAPNGRVNSLSYCVPVIEELAEARAKANVGAAAPTPAADQGGEVLIGAAAYAWTKSKGYRLIEPEPAPKGGYSEADKTPVFAAVNAFVRRFAATNGRQPDRDELRAHLFDFCGERGLDLGLVDVMYPAAVVAAKE